MQRRPFVTLPRSTSNKYLQVLSIGLFILLAISACTSEPTPTLVPTSAPEGGAGGGEPTPDTLGPVPILPTPVPGEPTLTASVNVYVRGGPGTNYPVLFVLPGSQQAQLDGISEDGSYYVINVPLSATGGWVDVQYATVTNADSLPTIPTPPVPPTVTFTPPGPDDPQATARDYTYVRTGPGIEYPAYGIADPGATGLVLGVSEDQLWYAVRLDPLVVGTGHGWVEVAHVETKNLPSDLPVIQAPPEQDPIVIPPPAEGAALATATTYVNVRTGPGLNYHVLGVGAPGASAEITGKNADGQWWQIIVSPTISGNERAWVSGAYVVTQNTENVPVVDTPEPPPAVTPPPGVTNCVLLSQTPPDGTVFAAGTGFTTVWSVQNTGSQVWDSANSSLAYVTSTGGSRLSSTDSYALTQDVAFGGTYPATVEMTAPGTAGQYSETWQITDGTTDFCVFWVIVEVK